MSNFAPGDYVVIIKSNSPHMIGRKAHITSPLTQVRKHRTYGVGAWIHYLDLPSARLPGKCVSYIPKHLAHVEDDGRTVVAWADCIWQPDCVKETS